MEFVRLWGTLRRRRLLLLGIVALALVAALYTTYQLPSMKKRSLDVGAATSQILIDSQRSTMVVGSTAEQISTLGTRSRVFAQYLSSRDAVQQLSSVTGIPATSITARGPFSSGTGIKNYQAQAAESRAADLVDEAKQYRLVYEAQEDVPIVTVYATAPTPGEALSLARGSFVVLQRFVDRLKLKAGRGSVTSAQADQAPGTSAPTAASDVVVRQLGAPEGGIIGGGSGPILMVLAFLAVLGGGCFAAVFFARLAEQRSLASELDELTAEQLAGQVHPHPTASLDEADDAQRSRLGHRSRVGP
jgi:hypothetical protein